MSHPGPTAEAPKPDEVRTALGRIVSSDIFRSSPQLAAFLSFVVEAVLQGQSDHIKGYTIGVEALKRGANFDPQTDPIVRVEATRLRRAMARYYSGPGADNPVRIELARGAYVPKFSYLHSGPGGGAPALGGLPSGNGMPTLLIQPFELLTTPGAQAALAVTLHDKLCDAFA